MAPWQLAVALAVSLAAAACGDGGGDRDGGMIAPDAGPDPDARALADAGARARYPTDAVRSPITASVVRRMRAIAAASPAPNPRVFMKVGASGTVSASFLHCLAGDAVTLDGRDELQPTIDYYLAPEAAGAPSWSRETLAAEIGRSASWAIAGDPSPLDQEIAAIAPRVALVNYGTNDMQLGVTHETALWPFYANLSALLDELEGQGIIPIVTGLNPRTDDADAARWVPTYDAVTRALAEQRQLPYIDLYLASVGLPDQGLVADGIHGNAFPGGACVFTGDGLQFNYNARNLATLQMLHDVRRTALDAAPAPDGDTAGYAGDGSPADPFVVDGLPFGHHGDTATSPHDAIDGYPACDAGQDESGPELFYRLELAEPTPVRILALDRDGVDVDLHLLAGGADPAQCVARAHRILEGTLPAGAHTIVVDTFGASAGPFTLVVVRCEPGDARCAPALARGLIGR